MAGAGHRGLALEHIWLAVVLAVTFAAANGFPVDQTDYWWTVKLGDGLWATGRLPASDPLAFTATRLPYVEQQWLAQVILAGVQRLGGLAAALALRAGLLLLAMALVYRVCRWATGRDARPYAAAGATLLALLLVLPGAATRPQLLALPLFALFLAGTTVWVARAWTLAVLPLAMVVWVNVHGSFPLGWVLVAVALMGRAWELRDPALLRADAQTCRLLLLAALCGAALFVNPYGAGILPWLVDFLFLHTGGKDAAVIATEWAPTSLAERAGALYFASVLLLVVVLVRAGPPRPADGWRLLAFGLLGLVAVRSTLWWGLVQGPALAWALARPTPPAPLPEGKGECCILRPPSLQGGGDGGGRSRQRLNAALIGLLLLAAAASLPPLRAALTDTPSTLADPTQPRAAAEFLAAQQGATRLYNYLDWGGYLAWRLGPAQRIFVDGRFGIYPPQVYRDYFHITETRAGWPARLATYDVDALVLSRTGQRELVAVLREAPHPWHLAYCDDLAVVYLRGEMNTAAVSCPPLPAAPH